MTHDLLKNVITDLKGTVRKIVVSDLKDNTFFALIYLEVNGETVAIDARPATPLRWRCGRGRRSSSRNRSSTTRSRSTLAATNPTPIGCRNGWRTSTQTSSGSTRCSREVAIGRRV